MPFCLSFRDSRRTWSKDIFPCRRSTWRTSDLPAEAFMCGCCSDARRRGYVLIFGALMLFFILVPAAGLAIDVGMMYLVKSLLLAASDGAALAGARALS